MGKCCDMINRTKFINVDVFEKIATAAFNSVMCDVGNFANITANTHLLLCHASLYMRWAQEEVGVSLGQLSENSIKIGNKCNMQCRKLYSDKNCIKWETKDIFMRRLWISDPYLICEGIYKQKIRRGHIKKNKKKV